MSRHISVDIETFSSEDITKSGLYRYVQSPDFKILLVAYSVDGGEVNIIDLTREKLPEELIDKLKSKDYIKHAYNAAFEWYCLSKYFGLTEMRGINGSINGVALCSTGFTAATQRALMPQVKP